MPRYRRPKHLNGKIMPSCINCETSNDIDAKFCKACGKTIKARQKETGRGFVRNDQDLAGQTALKTLRRSKLITRLCIAGCGLTTGFLLLRREDEGIVGGIVVLVLTLLLAKFFGRIRQSEYSALPGARDTDGSHRCVTCGRRGIWRRTVYKTSTTIAACSNCRTKLWYE